MTSLNLSLSAPAPTVSNPNLKENMMPSGELMNLHMQH
jgi:hypothetical protein